MEKPSIVELMSGINALRSDTPVLDSAYLDKDKALQLLSLNTHVNFDERCQDVSTLVLCSFDGQTYFIDENANIWDINEEGNLSILSVGITGYGINGFATDVAKKAAQEADQATLNDMMNYLEADFIESLSDIA